jgi:CBS domain containing-hemolysin-like protein
LDPVPALLGAFASAATGALFAAGDTAFTSLTSARLGALIDQSEGPQRAAYLRIKDGDAKLRSRYLLGRVLATAATAGFLDQAFQRYLPAYAFVVALVGTAVLTGTMFEVTTTLARKHADRVAPAVARYLRPLEIALLPIAVPLGLIGAWLSKKEPDDDPDPRITEVEVEYMVDEGEKSGLFAPEPAEMIRNVLVLSERTAKEVMVPREKVEAIEISTPIEQAKQRVSEVGHSRYPLYKDQLDNVVGLLHAKDLFKIDADPAKSLRDLARSPVNFVAGTQTLVVLLQEMKRRRQHLAVVVDELGSVSGIVTLEDILEEIVGDIRDEHDEAEDPQVEVQEGIEDLGDGRLVADANVSVGDLSKYLGGADLGDNAEGSLGEMLEDHFGKVPETGAAFSKFGLEFIVRDVADEHIDKIEIRPRAEALEADTSGS